MTDLKFLNAFQIFKRRTTIQDFYLDYEDLLRVTRSHPHINFRFTIAPSKEPPIEGLLPIGAPIETIAAEIQLGYDDGKEAVRRWKS